MTELLHERTLRVLEDLPPYFSDDPTTQAFLDPLCRELDRAETVARTIRDKAFPTAADDEYFTLSILEGILGLPVSPSGVTVEQRRSKVLAHIRKRFSSAGSDWEANVSEALGSTGWTYEEGPADYTITVRIPYSPGGYSAGTVAGLLRDITPAHLAISVSYSDGFLLNISLLNVESL